MLLTSKIIQSIIDSFITVSGESVAEHPKINKILKILEPIALPKAKTHFSLFCSNNRSYKFRKRSTNSNNRKSNEIFANT